MTRGRRVRRHRCGAAGLALLLGAVTAGALNAASASVTATVNISAVDVRLTLSTFEAKVGDSIRAQATVTNLGTTRLANIQVELRVDSAGVGIRSAPVVVVSRLQAGRSSTVTWKLCALQPGNSVILARATVDGAAVDSPARLLSVAGIRNRGCT